MKTRLAALSAITLITLAGTNDATAQTFNNSWIATTPASWLVSANWSLSRLPTNSDSIFITNASPSKTVFLTSATPASSMTISNLTISAPTTPTNIVVNTLSVTAGTNLPLRILNS